MSRSIFLSVAMPAIVTSNCLNPSLYQTRLFRKKAELTAASISYLSALRAAALSRRGWLGWMLSLPRQCRPSSPPPCSFCQRDVPQVLEPRDARTAWACLFFRPRSSTVRSSGSGDKYSPAGTPARSFVSFANARDAKCEQINDVWLASHRISD